MFFVIAMQMTRLLKLILLTYFTDYFFSPRLRRNRREWVLRVTKFGCCRLISQRDLIGDRALISLNERCLSLKETKTISVTHFFFQHMYADRDCVAVNGLEFLLICMH